MHIQKEKAPARIAKVQIGTFEKRNLGYDPYVALNFADALKFELFKRGVSTELQRVAASTTNQKTNEIRLFTSDEIKELGTTYQFDLYVQGVLAEITSGDTIETNTSSSITVFLYTRAGEKIGEVRYVLNDSLSNLKTLEKIASAIVKEISSVLHTGS